MYTLISGSQKPTNSNSMYFLSLISDNLSECNIYELKKHKYNEILENIQKTEVIVLSFPLYVDLPTSTTLSFLDYIIDEKIKLKDKLIYVVINCGFREGIQNITALNIIKLWCKKVWAIYGGSILIGAGEIVGKVKYKFVSNKALKDINKFSKLIKSRKKDFDIITTMDLLNNKMYCILANLSWTKKGKLNNLSKIDLKIK